jgi:hypothetical protein
MEDIFAREFDSFGELKNAIDDWSEKFYQPVNIRSSTKLKGDYDSETFNRLIYESIYFKCLHGGAPRTNKVDNSRPSQKTGCIECPVHFSVRLDWNDHKFKFQNKKNLVHNHPIGKQYYDNYSFIKNKKFSKSNNAKELAEILVKAETLTHQAKKILQSNYDINFSCKDLNNFSQKIHTESKRGSSKTK